MPLTLKFSDAIVEMNFSTDVKNDWLIGDEKPQRWNPCNAEVRKYQEFETNTSSLVLRDVSPRCGLVFLMLNSFFVLASLAKQIEPFDFLPVRQ